MKLIHILIYLIPSIISLFSLLKVKINGTDHHYHALIINAIKRNKHHFVLSNPYIIGENRMSYPQLLHWLLSFFDFNKMTKYSLWINLFCTFLSSMLLLIFVSTMIDYSSNILFLENKDKILILSGLAYISFPFNYDMVNAKNSGISARGLGLFLGQLYLYLISFYLITENITFLCLSVVVCSLILLSSAFAIQFLLFSTFLLSLFSLDLLILTPLTLSLVIIWFSSKKFFEMFFIGQFTHKKLYSKYFADLSILKHRYSIWRDFFYDFWVIIFNKKISLTDKLKYITSNSIVSVLISMPFVLLAITYVILNNDSIPFYLYIPGFVCFIIFVITTFRSTRFLGEPERYLEFAFGFYSIIVAITFFDYKWFYIVLLIYSVLFVITRLIFYISYSKTNTNVLSRNNVEGSKKIIEKEIKKYDSKQHVLSNSMQYSKILFNTKWKVFWHPIFQDKIGEYDFIDLYSDSITHIEESVLKSVINDFKINYFLCDFTAVKNKDEFFEQLENNNIKLKTLCEYNKDLILYKVCQKN